MFHNDNTYSPSPVMRWQDCNQQHRTGLDGKYAYGLTSTKVKQAACSYSCKLHSILEEARKENINECTSFLFSGGGSKVTMVVKHSLHQYIHTQTQCQTWGLTRYSHTVILILCNVGVFYNHSNMLLVFFVFL